MSQSIGHKPALILKVGFNGANTMKIHLNIHGDLGGSNVATPPIVFAVNEFLVVNSKTIRSYHARWLLDPANSPGVATGGGIWTGHQGWN